MKRLGISCLGGCVVLIVLVVSGLCLKYRVLPTGLPEKIANWWGYEKFRRWGGVRDIVFKDTIGLIPTMYIITEEKLTLEKTYVNATIRIEGKNTGENGVWTGKIRPRGNMTLNMNKMPFNIRFDRKVSLFGFHPAKKYVLLANYYDPSLLRNATAFKMAELLGMPYVNHTVPVNVVVNGYYRGVYDLTEKIDINRASVCIEKKEEVLLEIDNYTDRDNAFMSDAYGIRVSVKEGMRDLSQVKCFWGEIEQLVANISLNDSIAAKKVFERIDLDAFVNFTLTSVFSSNHDIFWPRSVFAYTTEGGSYLHFGPVWDFDQGYRAQHVSPAVFESVDSLVLLNANMWEYDTSFKNGAKLIPFFMKLVGTPQFRMRFCERWKQFREDDFDELLRYYDEYAAQIAPYQEYMKKAYPYLSSPPARKTPDTLIPTHNEMREWMLKQAEAIDCLVNHLQEGE